MQSSKHHCCSPNNNIVPITLNIRVLHAQLTKEQRNNFEFIMKQDQVWQTQFKIFSCFYGSSFKINNTVPEDCRTCLVRNHILPAYLAFKLGRYMIYIFKLPTQFGLAFLSIWIHSKDFKENTIYFWHTKTEIDCSKQSPKYRPAMIVANNTIHEETDYCQTYVSLIKVVLQFNGLK